MVIGNRYLVIGYHAGGAGDIAHAHLLQGTSVEQRPVACVADNELSGMVTETRTPSAVVVIHPRMRTDEVPLFADICAREMVLAGI